MSWQRPVPPALPMPASLARPSGVFWRPSEAFIAELAKALMGKRVLEIFAGNGLMAGALAQRGIDVLATSLLSSMDNHSEGLYHPILELDAIDAVHQHGAGRDVLLMCWPTTTPRAVAAVHEWTTQIAIPRPIAYVGEFTDYGKGWYGGCATDEFFEGLVVSEELGTYRGNMIERAVVARFTPDL